MGIDLPFLKRLVWTALLATALVAGAASFFSVRWAAHFLVIGLWMAINALILAALLWAGTSSPKRPFAVFVLAPIKIIWLGALGVYCWKASPPGSAVIAGLTMFFVAVVGSVLYWMQKQQTS